MALTKISTGGVKDDAASQAKIADEAVDEARLQISNAGTNGQFLSKQSGNTGGLTWADANSYTHPNHSGEVTSTGDGATVIASNIVDEDNLKISNAGTNGQFLQKQSGNTGGLTWADVTIPPAGNTIDLVADGAIAAGKPVIIKSNGKAAQIAEESLLITSAPSASNITYMSTAFNDPGHPNSNRIAYSPDDNLVINTFVKSSSGYEYPHYRLWKPSTSAGQISHIGNGGSIVSHQGSSDGMEAICYLSSSRFVYVYNRIDQNKARLAVGTVSGSGDSRTISWSADQELDGQAAPFYSGYQIQKIGANRIAVFCVARNGSCRWTDNKPGVIIIDFSGSTATYRSSAQLSSDNASNSFYYLSLAYNSTDDLLLATWRRSGSAYRMRAFKVDSGTSATITTGTELNTSDTNGRQTMVWQSPQNKFIFIYNQGQAASIKHVVCSVNSSSLAITQGTTNTISSSGGKSNEGLDLVVSAQNTIILKTIDNNRNPYTYRDDSFDGSNFNIDQQGKSTTGWDGYLDGTVDSVCMTESATQDIVSVHGTISSGSTNRPGGIVQKIVNPSSNITTSSSNSVLNYTNILGFAEDAISDGNTGTIKLPGNVVGNQSGLTAGTFYYHKSDGTLATSGDSDIYNAKAGTAISSTKLLIKDPNP